MKWLKRRRFRIPVSYVLAVWLYSIISAFKTGVFPQTIMDWIKFIFTPFLFTIQMPFLYMMGKGWFFTIIIALLTTGIYYLLKAVVNRAYPDPDPVPSSEIAPPGSASPAGD